LDNGHFVKLTRLSKSDDEWEEFFKRGEFEIEAAHPGLSTFAWQA